MAASDATFVPRRNTAYRVTFPILDADGDLVTGAATLDSEVSKDGGTFADCTNEATEIATSSGMYYLDLTSTEMDADTVAIIVKTGTAGAKTTPIVLYTATRDVDDLAWPTTTGRSIDVDASGGVEVGSFQAGAITAAAIATDAIDADAVADGAITSGVFAAGAITAAAIATDAIDSDALADGAITALTFAAGAIDAAAIATDAIGAAELADGAITAATFAAGAIDATAIAADAIGASELAADAVAEIADQVWDEARAGHVGAGSFGEGVASVTGSVGSVAAGGIVAASFGAGAIDAAAIATDAIGSAELAASAVTEIQSGLATSAEVAAVQADTDNLQTRIPAALVGGRMDSSVGAMAAGVVTAAAVASDAIDADALATDAVSEITAAILAASLTELAAVPGAAPTVGQALEFLFMALRNKITTTATQTKLHNDAGTAIATATVADTGAEFSRSEYA